MGFNSEKGLKETFVKGIKDGLSEAADDVRSKRGKFHNARNFDKIDYIMNGITKVLDMNHIAEWLKLPRGSYQVLLVLDSSNKNLYSFMSERRFKEIYNRMDGRVHYINGLVKYNDGYDRQQIMMEHPMLVGQSEKLQSLKEQIDELLGDMIPDKYFTVIFDMNGFDLLGVKCVLTSEHMEKISEENWGELIGIDYGDINYNDYDMTAATYDLGITLKAKYISDDNDIEDRITPKEDMKVAEAE